MIVIVKAGVCSTFLSRLACSSLASSTWRWVSHCCEIAVQAFSETHYLVVTRCVFGLIYSISVSLGVYGDLC